MHWFVKPAIGLGGIAIAGCSYIWTQAISEGNDVAKVTERTKRLEELCGTNIWNSGSENLTWNSDGSATYSGKNNKGKEYSDWSSCRTSNYNK